MMLGEKLLANAATAYRPMQMHVNTQILARYIGLSLPTTYAEQLHFLFLGLSQ